MKVLIICDHYPLSPRVTKMRNSLIKLYPNSTINIFAWNRSNKEIDEEYVVSYNQDLGYGNKLTKLINIPKLIKAVSEYIKKFEPTYIHPIDFEMLTVASLASKNTKLIYEVYDIKFVKNKFVNKIREQLEFYLIKHKVNKMILASPFFEKYYNRNELKGIDKYTINNKPSKIVTNKTNVNYMGQYQSMLKDKLVVGFIGTIRHKEILINLINASKKVNNVVLLFAGDGPAIKEIRAYIDDNSLNSKVIFTGRYSSENLIEIYRACDFIWAAYPNENLNVRYAISNKFFESIVFNKKIIVSNATMLASYVNEMKLGYVINPYNTNNIEKLLFSLQKGDDPDIQKEFGKGLFWENEETEIIKVYEK